MQEPVIRSLDLGFGNTKYVAGRLNGEFLSGSFPSLAPETSETTLGGTLIATRNTVKVDVNGKIYEVGPDAMQMQDKRDGRVLHKDYVLTDEYLALSRGALAMMAAPVIDLLVVGLPVNAPKGRDAALRDLLTGTHVINPTTTVIVKQVLVVSQPLGGFAHYAWENGKTNAFFEDINLIIDVGFFTLDWVVSNGVNLISKRCGGDEAGVSHYLERLGEELREKLELDDLNVNRLDEAVRRGYVKAFGKRHDLAEYLPAGNNVINEGLNKLQSKVGAVSDIDNIVLCGGGAKLYHPLVCERFPKHTVHIANDPAMSNAKGFYIIGEVQSKQSMPRAS